MGDRALLDHGDQPEDGEGGEAGEAEQGESLHRSRETCERAAQGADGQGQDGRDDELDEHQPGQGLSEAACPVGGGGPCEAGEGERQEQGGNRHRSCPHDELEPDEEGHDAHDDGDEELDEAGRRPREHSGQLADDPVGVVAVSRQEGGARLVGRAEAEPHELDDDGREDDGEGEPDESGAKQPRHVLLGDGLDDGGGEEGQRDRRSDPRHHLEVRPERRAGHERLRGGAERAPQAAQQQAVAVHHPAVERREEGVDDVPGQMPEAEESELRTGHGADPSFSGSHAPRRRGSSRRWEPPR